MSTFIYNGIVLTPVRTVEIEETPEWSEDGVDFLWMRYRITIEALYNPGMTAYTVDEFGQPVPEAGVYGPNTDAAIRFTLMQPRAQLIYGFVLPGGRSTQIMISPDNTGFGSRYVADANNGPNPIYCRIMRVDGNKTFHISYSIETYVRECDISNDCALISNRFSQSVDYDDRHRAVKASSGRAVFRTDLLYYDNQLADDFRALIFPPVSPGMRRTKIQVTVSSTQNILDWSCTDVEQMHELGETDARLGGSGVINVAAEYRLSTMAGEFAAQSPVAIAEVSIAVEGNKYSTNFNLLQAAFVVASTRLPIGRPNSILKHVAIGSSMTDRRVQVNMAYMLVPPDVGLPGAQQLPLDRLQAPSPFADAQGIYPSFPNDGGTRGTQLEGIVTAALNVACGDCAPTPDCSPSADGFGQLGTYCGPGPALEVQIVQYIPLEPTRYRQFIPPTSEYSIHSRYEDDRGMRQMAATGNGQEDSEVIQVRSRMTRRVVSWTAISYGAPPVVPTEITSDQNETFLYGYLSLPSVCLMPDGNTLAYRVSGEYVFAHTKPKGVGTTVPFDVPPWLTYVFAQDEPNAQMNLYGEDSGYTNYFHGLIDSANGYGSTGSANGTGGAAGETA